MGITRKQTRSQQYLEGIKQDATGAWRDVINSLRFPHTSEGALYGNSRTESTTGEAGNLGTVTVIGSKAAKKKPYFVASRTGQLTPGNAAKALDTMVTPVLSWATPNPFRAVEGIQTGDIDKTALEGLKLLGLKGIGTLTANTTRTGLTNGVNTVRQALINPAATLNSAKTAISTTARNMITPGSSFWTNPLTRRMMTGTALAKGFDLASTTAGYNSWGEGMSDVIHKTTGWNPQTSYTGQFLTEGLNPGWWVDPTKVEPVIGTIGRNIENGVKSIYRAIKPEPKPYTPGEFPQGLTSNEPLIARGTNEFVHPADAVDPLRRTYVSPQSSGWRSAQLRDPIMSGDNNVKNVYSLTRVSEQPGVRQSTTTKSIQLTDPRTFIRNSDEDGMLRISINDLQELAKQRIGRKLTDTEMQDFIGRTRDPLIEEGRIPNQPYEYDDGLGKAFIDFDEQYLDEALQNLNNFVSPKTIKTRYGNEIPYELDELVGDRAADGTYRLKPNVALQRTYAGEHGVSNWFERKDDALTKAQKYVATKYNPNRIKIGREIQNENPFDRSGVIVKGKDLDFSVDSFQSALKYIVSALKQGRRFAPLRGKDITYTITREGKQPISGIRSNALGQVKRYNEQFSDELIDAIKGNNGTLPDYITASNKDGYISLNNGNREVGRLTTRTEEDIVEEYKRMIDKINNRYNLKIGYPYIKQVITGLKSNPTYVKRIYWPNIYGLLYKKGGKF